MLKNKTHLGDDQARGGCVENAVWPHDKRLQALFRLQPPNAVCTYKTLGLRGARLKSARACRLLTAEWTSEAVQLDHFPKLQIIGDATKP